LDASYKQSLAAARSLGRAGLRVALGESASQVSGAGGIPAFRSRYSARNIIFPSYSGDGAPFAEAVVEFATRHPTRVILPGGDPTIAALVPHRARFAALGSTLAVASDAALKVANDKSRTLEIAKDLGIAHPKSIRVNSVEDLPTAINELGFPFVLKPTVSWTGMLDERVVPIEVIDKGEANAAAERFLSTGCGLLAQQWASGRREGVTLFLASGEVLATFGHVEHRTTPALGGASVVRESIPVPPDIHDPSVQLVTKIGLEGICEVEYRRDGDGRPLLMEINARPVGTVENAMLAGIDFPLMIWQWANGLPVSPAADYRTGIRMRWIQGDLRWLRENFRRSGRPDSVPWSRSLLMFGAEFFRTRHYDFFDLHDLGPARAEILNVAGSGRRSLARQRTKAHEQVP
jgi:predicted ATP-grasp superfamily ATP-dependent carboligase